MDKPNLIHIASEETDHKGLDIEYTTNNHKDILKNRDEHKSKMLAFKIKGLFCLFSGSMWMLYVGSHFMVGNISPYINSYFADATTSSAQTLFPTIVFVSIFSNFLGSQLVKRRLIHPRLLVLIAGMIGIGGIYASTFTHSWTLFRIMFPVSYGIAVGLAYMVHLYLTWKYIPGKEGIFTGIVNGAFGMGGALFNYLSSRLVNPDGIDALPTPGPYDKPFPQSVANNVPIMLRTLCYIWTGLFIVSLLTVQDHPSQDGYEVEKNELEDKKVKLEVIKGNKNAKIS